MIATETPRAAGWKQPAEVRPNHGAQVYYRTRCYSVLGYLDHEERWRDSHGRLEPQDVIAWTEVPDYVENR